MITLDCLVHIVNTNSTNVIFLLVGHITFFIGKISS